MKTDCTVISSQQLTADELKLLELYRNTNVQGQEYILKTADMTHRIYRPEIIVLETWKQKCSNG